MILSHFISKKVTKTALLRHYTSVCGKRMETEICRCPTNVKTNKTKTHQPHENTGGIVAHCCHNGVTLIIKAKKSYYMISDCYSVRLSFLDCDSRGKRACAILIHYTVWHSCLCLC